MSMPISPITRTARGLTCVASVPALIASKRSPARYLSSPSAIWLLAELWVHRNRTLLLCATSALSAAATAPALLLGLVLWSREQPIGGLAEQLSGGLPVERVEAPFPALLLAYQPGIFELFHVVGDLGLAHPEHFLELADADALFPFVGGDARAGEVAAASSLGHHGEHSHPYGIRESAAQGDEPVHSLLEAGPTADTVLLHDPKLLGAQSFPHTSGLRPRMKALASGTSAAAVSPQHHESSVNSF